MRGHEYRLKGLAASLAHRRFFGIIALVLLTVAAWARCARWDEVFTQDAGVQLVPTDSHYYVRFARLQLEHAPRFERFDPFVSFPQGASIIWPPLHTGLVALALRLGGNDLERSAAWVGPVASLLELALLTGLLLRLQGRRVALGALLLLATLPAAVSVGALGNADHHVHEGSLALAAALFLSEAWKQNDSRWAWATGGVLGMAPFWTSSGFVLGPALALGLGLASFFQRGRGGLALRVGMGALSVLLPGVLLWGAPRSLDYAELSAFHLLLVGASFAGAEALAQACHAPRRAALLGGASGGMGILLLPQLGRALSHLGREDPLLATVSESLPLWSHPAFAGELLGVALFLFPLAVVGLLLRSERAALPSRIPALALALCLSGAALLQARFSPLWTGPAALVIPWGLWALHQTLGPRARKVFTAMVGLSAAVLVGQVLAPRPPAPLSQEAMLRPALRWLKEHTPPPSALWDAHARPAYGVLSQFNEGHLVTLWGERPAVVTPFSQVAVHVQAQQEGAAVLAARTEEEAYEKARALKVRYLLLTPLVSLPEHSTPSLEGSVGRWLRLQAGLPSQAREASQHFRQRYASEASLPGSQGRPYARIFEVVPGAELVGRCAPKALVRAEIELLLPVRQEPASYVRETRADAAGNFRIRVAYASVDAGGQPYRVRCGDQEQRLWVKEADLSLRVPRSPPPASQY